MIHRSVFYAPLIASFLLVPLNVSAAILLSEIQTRGMGADDEFVELYNTSDTALNLSGWSLRRKSVGDTTTKGDSLKTFGAGDTIPTSGYFLWAASGGIYKDHADTTTGGELSENNSLGLFDKDGTLVDSITWGSGHLLPFSPSLFENPDGKEGFMRDLGSLAWTKTKNLTPTNANGNVFKDDSGTTEEQASSPYTVFINEILPNPKEKGDAGEFIELYNPGVNPMDLSGWELHDASATGKYIFPGGTGIAPLGYLAITDKDFSFSLNNSNETLSLWDEEKHLVHRITYGKTKAGVSLNLVGSILRGARKPTPGTENSENTDPITKERVPKKGYRGFTTEFRARGKDTDGDNLKFTWDFGDGHKSYKESTSHKYLKSGRYTVNLTTDDGIDTTVETFEIKIQKYEAPKIRIIAFAPNPKGKDSELEWIEIENREKRGVNLRDFGVATGTKKKSIANHPIRENFVIPAQSTKRLTREFSLFTLGNVRGHIELRTPDGKTIQHLKYKFEKSLADDAVLKKEKGQALTLVPIPVEATKSETGKEGVIIAPETEDPRGIDTSAPELRTEDESANTAYPKEFASSNQLTWAEIVSYRTPFSLPKSFAPKTRIAPIRSVDERNEEIKNTPARWQDAVNIFLNRVLQSPS